MAVIYRTRFIGEREAIDALAAHLPELIVEEDGEGGYWISSPQLQFVPPADTYRDQIDKFTRLANTLIALSDPRLTAINHQGAIEAWDGTRCDRILLAETAVFEAIIFPATLSATGQTAEIPSRPIAVRAAELSAREPRFERATNIIAECGEDVPRLYMVMELIEKAHGGFPKKADRPGREAFSKRVEVREEEWAALHRTARPHRHAEPYDDPGPILTVSQVRLLLHHALKLWLAREVPT